MIIRLNLGRTSDFHKKHAYVYSVVSMYMYWGGGVQSILKEYILIITEDQIHKINTMNALESSAFRFILFLYIRSI